MSYDFSSLSERDLEDLTRDILIMELKISFQSFKAGADGGIDLRYSTNSSENEIIVQVKHYFVSGITKLLSDLKKIESEKVKTLNPKRYIFVTSVGLTPQDKIKIKKIFDPFILSTNDIFGKNDLNNSLRNHTDIEDRHFKLWLSNTNVLKRILKNGTKGRSEFAESKIRQQIRLYAPTSNHNLAIKVLNKNNFILITGAPGIGKSTLANILTYQLLADGFELVYVRDIKEAEDSFLPETKQVFYFDDFLGSATLEIKTPQNSDSAIISFIERVKGDSTKKLLLTCRTTILNQAKEESEKLHNSKIDLANHEVAVEDYRPIDKARILYNHIVFSNLSDDLKSIFFKNNFYWKVINHKHYNPRIIDFFTDIERLQPHIKYEDEVLNFLNEPGRIWEKTFTKQISLHARLLLVTLFSIHGKYVTSEEKLKQAFTFRIKYEMAEGSIANIPNPFLSTSKELMGAMINKTTDLKYHSTSYTFLNPSVEDFLFAHLKSDVDEYFRVLTSAVNFEPFISRITTSNKNTNKIFLGESKNLNRLYFLFKDRLPFIDSSGLRKDLDMIIALIRLFPWQMIKSDVELILNNLTITNLDWHNWDNMIEILKYIGEHDLTDSFYFSFENIFLAISSSIPYFTSLELLSKLIRSNNYYSELIDGAKLHNSNFYITFQNNIDQAWDHHYHDFLVNSYGIERCKNKSEIEDVIKARMKAANQINDNMHVMISPIIMNSLFDSSKQLENNMQLINQEKYEIKEIENNIAINENVEINRLFNNPDDSDIYELPF